MLSGGRLTLGVAVGYNALEFAAMGSNFKTRGKRFEEQIDVMRRLWTENDVSYDGVDHKFENVCMSPRPIQRPIPLFFGMGRKAAPIPPDVVLRRVGRLADGWLPIFGPDAEGQVAVDKVHEAAREAGRDPEKLIMSMSIDVTDPSDPGIIDEIKKRQDFGAKQINLNLQGTNAQEQIELLKKLADNLIKRNG
ncbi:MAG: LLM class flavin-dependent oxidoreductase [Emcibacter sp.]|nr:LLM class flavin-dependent oxidoreductase [Emcibacter sp.]